MDRIFLFLIWVGWGLGQRDAQAVKISDCAAENATQVGANIATSFRSLSNYLAARIEPTEIIARMP
jgi:hypothetical protein